MSGRRLFASLARVEHRERGRVRLEGLLGDLAAAAIAHCLEAREVVVVVVDADMNGRRFIGTPVAFQWRPLAPSVSGERGPIEFELELCDFAAGAATPDRAALDAFAIALDRIDDQVRALRAAYAALERSAATAAGALHVAAGTLDDVGELEPGAIELEQREA